MAHHQPGGALLADSAHVRQFGIRQPAAVARRITHIGWRVLPLAQSGNGRRFRAGARGFAWGDTSGDATAVSQPCGTGGRILCLGYDVFQPRRRGEAWPATVPVSYMRSTPKARREDGASSDRIMALFLEIVGAVTLVVLAIVVILIIYVMWLVHRAERRDARWR